MKAVMVIEMPDCCNNCLCFDGMEDRNWCTVLNEDMCFASYGRLGNCPLRPLPEQMSWGHTSDFIEGYNACLDEITGDEE